MNEIAVFSGSAHPDLAAEICAHLQVPLLPSAVHRFANDCLEVQLQANCRERDVFLIQPLVAPVQEHLVELLLMLDAARGASAQRTTVVMPHYAYARSDKKDAPRISIGGRLVADLMTTAGASRVLTMALHAPQVLRGELPATSALFGPEAAGLVASCAPIIRSMRAVHAPSVPGLVEMKFSP